MQKGKSLFFSFLCLCLLAFAAQAQEFSRQDTLRGTITPERAWWNITHYLIDFTPNYDQRSLVGKVTLSFKVIQKNRIMQIDLQQPMQIDKIIWRQQSLVFRRDGNAYFVEFPKEIDVSNRIEQIEITYSGKPRVAIRPPWDGGWIWAKDKQGNAWMSVACQGLGASVWYPCKDHQSDEPDSAAMRITVPKTLSAIGNGRLKQIVDNKNGTHTFSWVVTQPINSYNLVPYIGKYANWVEVFQGEKGKLDCSYWVLDYNLEKAKSHFKVVSPMMQCFEHWLGAYPFYEDSYKLVESPHLGMEHQSAVAYGNEYMMGYKGADLSGTGWGLKWDFIIIHESGHEWFGNNISTNDIADMWVHEGFTAYTETIFTQCMYGKEAGNDYVTGTRRLIQNDIPIIGEYGVNKRGSGDMYYKGANMLHTIRHIVNDDEKFRKILRGLSQLFYHKTVDSKQVENYFSEQTGINLSKVFDQYLRTTQIPFFEYKVENGGIKYRWTNCVKGFDMSIKVKINEEVRWLKPSDEWQTVLLGEGAKQSGKIILEIDRNFYVSN
jgi:aminopeptidase N